MRLPQHERISILLALVAGAGTVFAFAPFAVSFLPVVTLGALFYLWQFASPGTAARTGLAFGAGLFGAGVSWVYVALNTFGGMPAILAAIGTAGFCAYLALFPAAAGWAATRWTAPGGWPRMLTAAAAWPLTEWARSFLFSGFPWLGVGYAQLPRTGPGVLAGYAPVGGVWLVSLALSIMAAALAYATHALAASPASPASQSRRPIATAAMIALLVAGGGAALQGIAWTAHLGSPLTVSLVQGNVTQDRKFDAGFRDDTFRLYTTMARASRGRLVVLPESALPTFADEVPDAVFGELLQVANARNGAVLTGVFTAEPPLAGAPSPRYYNSVVSLGSGEPQLYRKRHLVPFGETIPLEPIVGWFIRSVLAIPLANQSAGDAHQPALALAGQKVAVNICYEDVFGPDIRSQAADATLLVNVTNDAWYAHSLAAEQHNQIAAMRALETGRPLLRATNTGITSAIDHEGREIARLPWFTRDTLEVTVTGRQGVTPYVRWGDALPVLVGLALFGTGLGRARWRRAAAAG